jgi:hypothetical protein
MGCKHEKHYMSKDQHVEPRGDGRAMKCKGSSTATCTGTQLGGQAMRLTTFNKTYSSQIIRL